MINANIEKEQLIDILINNNTSPLIIEKLADLLLESAGEDWEEFTASVECFFWQIDDNYISLSIDYENEEENNFDKIKRDIFNLINQ
jgi:hypothetical protein